MEAWLLWRRYFYPFLGWRWCSLLPLLRLLGTAARGLWKGGRTGRLEVRLRCLSLLLKLGLDLVYLVHFRLKIIIILATGRLFNRFLLRRRGLISRRLLFFLRTDAGLLFRLHRLFVFRGGRFLLLRLHGNDFLGWGCLAQRRGENLLYLISQSFVGDGKEAFKAVLATLSTEKAEYPRSQFILVLLRLSYGHRHILVLNT